MPTDRPIDGIDASAFLLGQSATTGRDHVIYYGSDAAVMSVKWKTMKIVFRYTESASGPIVKPQWPLIFDLIDDPNEEWDLMAKRLDCIWVMGPVAAAPGRASAERRSLSRTSNRARSSPATSDTAHSSARLVQIERPPDDSPISALGRSPRRCCPAGRCRRGGLHRAAGDAAAARGGHDASTRRRHASAGTPTAGTPAAADAPIPDTASPYDALPEAVRPRWTSRSPATSTRWSSAARFASRVTFNRTHYFIDKGQERGLTYESLKLFENDLNTDLKTGNLKVHVVIVPMSRDQLYPALASGKVDMVAAMVTVTPEREKLVAFSEPTRTNVSQVVVTGPGAPPIATVDDLAGQEVFVRKGEHLRREPRPR